LEKEYYGLLWVLKLNKKIMSYFDSLIDKNNGKPKVDIEYIYRMDMVWIPGKLEHKTIKIGTIVNNTVQMENGSYQFNNKETGELLQTNYAWALAENTPENLEKIKRYDEEFIRFKEYEKFIQSLWDNIVTLKK